MLLSKLKSQERMLPFFSKAQERGAARLDLLAGLVWAHCHIKDLAPALVDISIDQLRRLAASLQLDHDNDIKHDYWPDLVSRKWLMLSPAQHR